jgi:hypothetical protein
MARKIGPVVAMTALSLLPARLVRSSALQSAAQQAELLEQATCEAPCPMSPFAPRKQRPFAERKATLLPENGNKRVDRPWSSC